MIGSKYNCIPSLQETQLVCPLRIYRALPMNNFPSFNRKREIYTWYLFHVHPTIKQIFCFLTETNSTSCKPSKPNKIQRVFGTVLTTCNNTTIFAIIISFILNLIISNKLRNQKHTLHTNKNENVI